MPSLSLDAIEQRIAQRDAELQRLRRDVEARRSRLQALTRRKEALQAKLREIETEMAAVAGGTKRPQTAAPKAAPKKPTPKPSTTGKSSQPSLPALLVSVMRSAGRPLTAKHLVQEVKRRGFKSSSANFTKMVEARLWDLKKQGVVQRAADQPGYTLNLQRGAEDWAYQIPGAKDDHQGNGQNGQGCRQASVRSSPPGQATPDVIAGGPDTDFEEDGRASYRQRVGPGSSQDRLSDR